MYELTDEGTQYFVALDVAGIPMKPNKRGTFRPYAELTLTPELAKRLGRREVTVALYTTRADRRRGFNRAANVRAIAPGSQAFEIYHRLRSDAESLNRSMEDSLYRHHRAHSVGWRRQLMNQIGFAMLTNALTLHRFRDRTAMAAAA